MREGVRQNRVPGESMAESVSSAGRDVGAGACASADRLGEERAVVGAQVLIGRARADVARGAGGAGARSAEKTGLAFLWPGSVQGGVSCAMAAADWSSSGVAWFALRMSRPVAPKLKPANEPASRTTAATSSAAPVLSFDRCMFRSPGMCPASLDGCPTPIGTQKGACELHARCGRSDKRLWRNDFGFSQPVPTCARFRIPGTGRSREWSEAGFVVTVRAGGYRAGWVAASSPRDALVPAGSR